MLSATRLPRTVSAPNLERVMRAKAQKILGQSNDEYLDWLSNVKEPMKTVFAPVTSGTLEAFTVSEELNEK